MAVGKERTKKAVLIRDHLLPILCQRGELKKIGEQQFVCLAFETLKMSLATPFTKLVEGAHMERDRLLAAADTYEMTAAIQRADQTVKAVLPWRLDVWSLTKVMSLEWSESNDVFAISFQPGPWEELALSLY